MPQTNFRKIIFIINKKSGDENTDWEKSITDFFEHYDIETLLYILPQNCDLAKVKKEIVHFKPQLAVAVGGDGTVKLVAECIMKTNIVLGILPAGSANGMAKELNISEEPEAALKTLFNGVIKKIHLTKINDQLCIHLADVGFNAYVIRKFEIQKGRGMWGYFKAAIKVLFAHKKMQLALRVKNENVELKAAMIVIANATCYGSGALINPNGSLEDELFEVIAVKKISLPELFKMAVSHTAYNPAKTEVFQTDQLTIRSIGNVHFQVDGEYLGKVKSINAKIVPGALSVLVPETDN